MENMRKDVISVNLHDEINKIIGQFTEIEKIYLFGSRAYKTNSLRSDIDLLLYSQQPLALHAFPELCHKSIDLFETIDFKQASSYSNNSKLYLRNNYSSILEQIDAILLWDNENNFNRDNIIKYGKQVVLSDIDFPKSVLEYVPREIDRNIPIIDLGENIPRFLQILSENIRTSIEIKCKLTPNTKAKNIIDDNLKIESEYDFQNFIYLICKPWFKDIQREHFVINISGINRTVDFALSNNKIIIEAKYIKDAQSKNEVTKDLEGIKSYYGSNPNIAGLLFIILIEKNIDIDKSYFKNLINNDSVYIDFIDNN